MSIQEIKAKMDAEKEAKAEFNAWFENSGWTTRVAHAAAWESWQASRAGVVVVLPEKLEDAYESGYGDGQNNPNGYGSKEERDKCVSGLMQSFEAAGVQVAT